MYMYMWYRKNDVYNRLFKDSKIKQVKESEFYDFLKLKQAQENTDIINTKFNSKIQKPTTKI